MAKDYMVAMIIVVCGIIGIVLAIMVQMMYADQLLVNELVTGTITLRVIQTIIILMWMVIGVCLAAVVNRK